MVYDTRPVSSTAKLARPDGIVKRVLWPSNKPMKMKNALGTESAESHFRANPATGGRTRSLLQRCESKDVAAMATCRTKPYYTSAGYQDDE
jgi:hypothetical protein